MWNEPNPDPGGTPGSSLELTDLKDENEQQKLLIAQLKEMLRKEQSTVTNEKIEEYINTLSKLKAKKSRTKRDESGSADRGTAIDSVKKEKVILLKQQLEENKAKLAERDKSQKGIEEMVTQLKAQLNDSQQPINAPLNLSVVDQKHLDYSKVTSQEELYNILLVKERKITELLNKTQKQEATILDLQENLKEKDSVIDARTKAITLMTDSLSKKGKDTLDTLDETKEQMRTMQENFVKLESEMKARQLKLLEDLKAKNLEITELKDLNANLEEKNKSELQNLNTEHDDTLKEVQEQVVKLRSENKNFLKETQDLEKKLQDAYEDINRLKSTGVTAQPAESNDNDIAKLKKQLEDSNKNMIKIKAQSKSKIKGLTKQIEDFKKTNDVNALVVQLQNENTKLSEKIAELEEEKGNMQLKMVESTDSTKEVVLVDEAKLQEKLQQNAEDIDEKNKIISLLEAEIISLKEEINGLKDELSGFSHFENVQVTSEIKSIEIEEQLEKLENENKLLKETIERAEKEKEELEYKLGEILKEKQDLSNKLDNCIQENIDLIDKLEKLSAEKVSSAESIEIVEGLTQQEKLELAAYQKHLDVNLEETKSAEDDVCEPPQELNESVIQLTEDSAELLKKIEMFNSERKEVMGKMEELRDENNRLNMKITEIENSRDVLADTYEQLQSEKEELQAQYDDLLKKTENIGTDSENKAIHSDDSNLTDLNQLRTAYEHLQQENENLKTVLKQFDTKFHEKDNIDSELQAAQLKIEDLESKLKSNLEEITNYQSIIEENKIELVASANLMNELQAQLSDRENDVKELNILINELNVVVANLQTENEKLGNFEVMESKVEELKLALNQQIEQAQDYAEELAYNNNIITDLKDKLEEMNKKILEAEHEMETKTADLEKFKVNLLEKDDLVKNLQNSITEKDKNIKLLTNEMKERFLVLQKQLDGNNSSLEEKIKELTNKNKEQLEKMKKIAANLKKKTQAYQELEGTYLKEKEKWETETNKKEVDHLHLLTQVKELKQEINSKTVKLEESETKISDLTLIIQSLEQDLHNSLAEMRRKEEKLNEVNLKQELSSSLHEEFEKGLGNTESAHEEKIRELQLIIETNEADLAHYKERLQQLEEDLVSASEDKNILQNTLAELQQQLQLSSQSIEEQTVLEETLEKRLEEVSANDEVLSKRLKEVLEEHSDLLRKSAEQEESIVKLKAKLKKAYEKVTQFKSQKQSIEELELENDQLKKQLFFLEANTKHIQDENEAWHQRNQKDYEKIEADYQGQLEELLKSKNELLIDCEKLREELRSAKEKEEELLDELAELRDGLQEMDKLKDDINAVKQHEEELLAEIVHLKSNKENNEHEIERLSQELEKMTVTWNSSVTRTKELNNQISKQHGDIENLTAQIENLQKHLLIETARDTIEEVIIDAKEKVFTMNSKEVQTDVPDIEKPQERNIEVSQEAVPTFQWSQNQQFNPHWDDFIQQTEPTQNVIPNATLSNLESQIFSPADIDKASDKIELQKIEFEEISPSLGEQSIPVVEEVSKPKHAYLTYQPGVEAFGENDDGWGWGPEEAKLEEEHQFRAEGTPQMQNLRSQLAQAIEKVQVLQVERENHLEEMKQLQIKSGKLIKKCKELKVQNDQLLAQKPAKKSSEDFLNLDDTIQEELKSQVAHLEKRIKEVMAELEKEKLEKNKIGKQVDVLITANERMVENKEIQDAEIFRWKRKYEDIEEKLQQVEWNSDGFSEHPKPKPPADQNETIEDLQKQIQELSQDNEELQVLLNEQRELRIQAEKLKVTDTFPQLSQDIESKIKMLEQELTGRNREIEAVLEEKNRIIDSLQRAIEEKNNVIDSIEEEMRVVEGKNKYLEKLFKETENYVRELCQKLEVIEGDKIKLEAEISEKDSNLDSLKTSFREVQADTSKDDRINELKNRSSQLENEKYQLENQLKDTEVHLHSLLETHQNFMSGQKEMEELRKKLSQSEESKIQLEAFVNEKDVALQQLKEAYDYYMNLSESLQKQSENLSADLENVQQKYQELQQSIHKNESELQEQLQKQKLSYEQLQKEQTDKLEEIQKKYDELQVESKQKIESLEQKISEIDTSDAKDKTIQLELLLTEKDARLKELENGIENSNIQKKELEDEVHKLKNDLEKKKEEYEILTQQLEEEFAKKMTEVEEKWMTQVDERGNAVAESWKFHLTLVEQEFESVRNKMKNEINELEEKCNALANENNELRKNVDAEIRNEVDRMTAAQQSITDLSKKLTEREQENLQIKERLTTLEELEAKILEREQELSGLKLIVDTAQQQFEEKRQVVEDIIKILEKKSPWPIGYEKQDIINEFQRQLNIIDEKDVEVNMLVDQIKHLESVVQNGKAKEEEIQKLEAIISNYQKEYKDKDEYIETAKVTLPELEHNLQQKDNEIENLRKSVDEYKAQVENMQQDSSFLQEKVTKLNQIIEDYKQKLESLQQTNDTLEWCLNERNTEIKALAEKLNQVEGNKNDNNKEVEKLQSEITAMKQNYGALQQLLQESQQEGFTMTQELAAKTHELEAVRQQVVYLQQNVEILENEVKRLKEVLHSKDQEFSEAFENLKKSRLTELETHYEELIAAKDIDNNTLKAQLAEIAQHSQSLSDTIGMEVKLKQDFENKCLELEQKVSEQTDLIEEDEKQLTELRSLIEEQAATIEEMKKELYEKSKDYDSLVAEVDMGRRTISEHGAPRVEASASTSKSQYSEDDLSEPVSRAELDLALYMLHQRDVRCEELTVELTQLLEERDTLQLRLSNSIREKEEIRRKLTGTEVSTLSGSSNPEPGIPTSLTATDTDLTTNPLEVIGSEQNLANKLSELRTIGYNRDKTFVDEQQQRRLQQISIMQQHISEASKLPPEAAAKLVDATYTLSRDVQSPSKVLLNWLWGRSTPKQNDT